MSHYSTHDGIEEIDKSTAQVENVFATGEVVQYRTDQQTDRQTSKQTDNVSREIEILITKKK